MKFGIRTPSLNKRIAARTSWKRYVRHSLGVKAPRGWGWLTNPKRAAYNRVYNRTTVSVDRLLAGGGRRRRHRSDASALVVVVAVIVGAAAGIYLLVAAAVAAIGWLVHLSVRRPAHTTTEAPRPAEPLPPGEEYAALVSVDPTVFDDAERFRAAARAVFHAWLAHVPRAPAHGEDLLRDVSLQHRRLGRLVTEIEGHGLAWHATPFTGRQPAGTPPLDPAKLDAWNPPADLKTMSRYIATCWTCNGQGRVACSACGGSARVACTACEGAGKVMGITANGAHRLLNCKICRGKATVTCAVCSRGQVDCATCGKAKKLECWLEVETSSRRTIQIEPEGGTTGAFEWAHAGAAASPEQIGLDAHVAASLEQPGALASADLATAVPGDWLADFWPRFQLPLAPGERIRAQAFTLLDIPSARVTYAAAGDSETVTFEGLRLLAPPPEREHLLVHRAVVLGRARLVLALLPIAALVLYALRGSYFFEGRAAPFVAGTIAAAAATAACVYGVLWHATLGRRTALRWALAAIVPLVAGAACAMLAEPSAERARSYTAAGSLELARAELTALGSEDSDLAPQWADLHVAQASAAASCTGAASEAQQIPAAFPQHAAAVARADALALTEAGKDVHASDVDAASRALTCASPAARDSANGRALRATIAETRARSCMAAADWDCAVARTSEARDLGAQDANALDAVVAAALSARAGALIAAAKTEPDLGRRVTAESDALAFWTRYLAARTPKPPTQLVALQASHARDEKLLARQEELARQRAAAEQRRQAAEAERARAREEAAERARESRPLVCNDGSLSPSCICGGSWQGCCSHHGGVAGCQ